MMMTTTTFLLYTYVYGKKRLNRSDDVYTGITRYNNILCPLPAVQSINDDGRDHERGTRFVNESRADRGWMTAHCCCIIIIIIIAIIVR